MLENILVAYGAICLYTLINGLTSGKVSAASEETGMSKALVVVSLIIVSLLWPVVWGFRRSE